MKRPVIRQNPTPNTKTPPGEICPLHGWYLPPYAVVELRRMATGPGVPTAKARRLLEESEQLRRTCPSCGGAAPTMQQVAIAVRRAVERAAA